VAPTPVKMGRPRRHTKPHDERPEIGEDLPLKKLLIAGGRADGIEPGNLIAALTGPAKLDGEAVRNVVVLEYYSFADVPEQEAERVVELSDGTDVADKPLRLELVA
jgi:ATP-dependent RNA helicase DeaD